MAPLSACLLTLSVPTASVVAQTARGTDAAIPTSSHGHALPSPSLRAQSVGTGIVVDGKLDEADWLRIEPGSGFRQSQPNDGDAATQETEIRVLFDHDALYIGARMFDSLGAKGVRTRLVRRDQGAGGSSDWIQLVFDTFHDHIGRTSFSVNPSGVRQDGGVAASFPDPSWDPVWDVATSIDSLGWTAEFRIPFSQLRFPQGKDQVWGLQVWRTVSRLNEFSMWSYWSNTESGGPQRFGHIEGIAITGTPRRLELAPYVVGGPKFSTPASAADPFHDGSEVASRVGADLKYLLTSNMTLSATVNPDFGQVEVDPAVVNLSAFETFFPERRPFFIEGAGAFSFGGFNCFFCSNVSSMSLVFTRRIGRAPQGGLPADAEFSDIPEASTILGATKITGRTSGGLTIGVLDAVTAKESAQIMRSNGGLDRATVEPLSNYFVGRVKKDMRGGDFVFGGIVTSVVRDLPSQSPLRNQLTSHSETGGIDWRANWKNRTYSFMGNIAVSNATGDPAAILRLQRSSARYFQRPDRGNGGNGVFSNSYDSSATSLRGFGGYARLGKDSGDWLWEAAVNYRSPGFEANDLGFNTRSDYVWMNANLVRSFPNPGAWYRWLWITTGAQQQYNFDGDLNDRQFHGGIWGQFLNYWNFGVFGILRPSVLDDRATRGGPVVARPRNVFVSANGGTDSRKAISFNLNASLSDNTEGGSSRSISLNTTLKPASNVSLSLGPSWNTSLNSAQFVRSVSDPLRTDFFGRRYVFADTRQTSLSMNTRLNITFTPNLTLELFAQPFISSADFQRFKEFANPRQSEKLVYGRDVGTVTPTHDARGQVTTFTVDPDGDGPSDTFAIGNPNFVFRSLRGNAVIRWEYRPGSTLFFVWTQDRSATDRFTGDFSFRSPDNGVFGSRPNNTLLVKASYWLNY